MFNKKSQPKESSKEYANDAGSLSLWANTSGKGTHVASGVVTLVDPISGEETKLRVFMYENINKKGEHSPDYFGFLKEDTKEETKAKVKPAKGESNEW